MRNLVVLKNLVRNVGQVIDAELVKVGQARAAARRHVGEDAAHELERVRLVLKGLEHLLDVLGRVVLHVASGMPSAQILIILLHKFGMSKSAAELSFLFVFQYAASLLTMTVLISFSLQEVY